MKKKLIILVVIVLVILGISFIKKDSQEITIGALYAQSGPVSTYGERSIRGARDAVKYFEEKNNVKVNLVEEDTVGDPKVGVSVAQKLFAASGVNYAVIGLSNVSAAVAPLTNSNDVVLVTDATTIGINRNYNNFFQNFLTSLNGVGPYMKNSGVSKLAIIYTNDEFGIQWENNIRNAVKDKITVTSYSVARDAKDFSTEAAKIKQFNPDKLVVVAYGSSLNPVYKDLNNIGIDNKKFVSYLSCTLPGVLTANSLEGSLSYEFPVVGNKEIVEWIDGHGGEYSTFYTSAFENTLILLTAIDKVGDNPEKVREYLKTAKIDGLYGTVEFGDDRVVERDLTLTKVENNKCVAL